MEQTATLSQWLDLTDKQEQIFLEWAEKRGYVPSVEMDIYKPLIGEMIEFIRDYGVHFAITWSGKVWKVQLTAPFKTHQDKELATALWKAITEIFAIVEEEK